MRIFLTGISVVVLAGLTACGQSQFADKTAKKYRAEGAQNKQGPEVTSEEQQLSKLPFCDDIKPALLGNSGAVDPANPSNPSKGGEGPVKPGPAPQETTAPVPPTPPPGQEPAKCKPRPTGTGGPGGPGGPGPGKGGPGCDGTCPNPIPTVTPCPNQPNCNPGKENPPGGKEPCPPKKRYVQVKKCDCNGCRWVRVECDENGNPKKGNGPQQPGQPDKGEPQQGPVSDNEPVSEPEAPTEEPIT